jgi:DNA-binding transcriptional regulator YhcF (GntR family)
MAGGSDLRVLVALVMISLHAGKLRVGVSYRQIAERSGVSLGTVVRALGALEGTWIRRTHLGSRHRRADRSVFQMLAPSDWLEVFSATDEHAGGTPDGKGRHCSLLAVDSKRLGEGLRDPGHPVWKRRSTAWRMWHVLCDETSPVNAATLARTIDAAPRTVWRNLSWLASNGLVVGEEGSWSAVPSATAVQLVEHLEPQRELVRERHRIEREQHRVWLAERATARRLAKGHVLDDDHVSVLRQARARLATRWVAHRTTCRAVEAVIAARPLPHHGLNPPGASTTRRRSHRRPHTPDEGTAASGR